MQLFSKSILVVTFFRNKFLLQANSVVGFASLRNIARNQPKVNSAMSAGEGSKSRFIDKLALIMINSENKQLVARSKGKDVFYTPGGKREQGETDREALLRECEEELGVNLVLSKDKQVTIEAHGIFEAQAYGKPKGTMVRMTCYRICPRTAELELASTVKASAEIEELKWIDSNFDREKLTVTGVMILDNLKENGLIV